MSYKPITIPHTQTILKRSSERKSGHETDKQPKLLLHLFTFCASAVSYKPLTIPHTPTVLKRSVELFVYIMF